MRVIARCFDRTYRTGSVLATALPNAIALNLSSAKAEGLMQDLPNLLSATTTILGIGFGFLIFYKYRKLSQLERTTRNQLVELEHQLNNAEAAIHSESQIMLSWRGQNQSPERIVGHLRDLAGIPEQMVEVLNFQGWLENDSADILSQSVIGLRKSGTSFNIAVKTREGDLLEADGRATGGQATLRLRPLAGERLNASETIYDSQKLAKQVERLSAILDSAPFPIWIRGKEGTLSWVNQAYVQATETEDSTKVISGNLTIAKLETLDTSKADLKLGLKGRAHAIQSGKMKAFNIYDVELAVGQAGFAIDVTPLEALEKEFDRHINAHASTLDKLSTAIAIFGPDQRLRFFNQGYLELWNFDETWLQTQPSDGEILDRLRDERNLPEEANYREWRAKQLSAYTNLEMRESYWYLPDGRSLRVICEQHPFGGVTYLYENLTKEYQLESRYNELFEVQRETLDNLAEAVALSGSDGRLKLFNPAFMRFWSLDSHFLSQMPHVEELCRQNAGYPFVTRQKFEIYFCRGGRGG